MDWKTLITCLLGALLYIAVSEILSNWSHALAGIFAGIVFIANYCLMPKRLNLWIRVLVPIAVTILLAFIIRFIAH